MGKEIDVEKFFEAVEKIRSIMLEDDPNCFDD